MKKAYVWFAGIETRQELKARYKELVKTHHPDCGGNEADMKAINNEYRKSFGCLPIGYYCRREKRPSEIRAAPGRIS